MTNKNKVKSYKYKDFYTYVLLYSIIILIFAIDIGVFLHHGILEMPDNIITATN